VKRLDTLGFGGGEAKFINDKGQVAGNVYDRVVVLPYDRDGLRAESVDRFDGFMETSRQHAFIHDNGVTKDLGTLGGTSSYVQALNNRGDVLGASSLAGDRHGHAFLYTEGRMAEFGNADQDSSASLLNDRGTVAGQIGRDAFVYQDGEIHVLDELGTGGSYVTQLNQHDMVAGTVFNARGTQAFLYKDGETQLIPVLPGLDGERVTTHVLAMNELGDVVGMSFGERYEDLQIFVYQDGEVINVSDMASLLGERPNDRLFFRSIDDQRRILASDGLSTFLLTPVAAVPEPSSMAFMLMGLAALMSLSAWRARRGM
jgi:probable HAF family extracellular repeat protein